MQIQWSDSAAGYRRGLDAKDPAAVKLIEGAAGYAVRLGDKLVGFSGKDIASVALAANDGKLRVRLLTDRGDALAEYRVPSPATLTENMDDLIRAGLRFSAEERRALVDLMRLSLSGGVGKTETLLLLDEISHVAATPGSAAVIDVGEAHAELAEKTRALLAAMPQEIQRFVILSNDRRFPEDVWRAAQLIGKVSLEGQPALARFIEEGGALGARAQAEILQAAANLGLFRGQGVRQVDPEAFRQLVEFLKDTQVAGSARLISTPPGLARFLIDRFQLVIPDFSAAPSFEELERRMTVARLVASGDAGEDAHPLSRKLAADLDAGRFRALAEFLAGKPGARFTLEVKESALYFLKNPSAEPPSQRLSSVQPGAFQRLLAFLLKRSPEAADLAANARSLHMPGGSGPAALQETAARFVALDRVERLALFVLDRLDPLAHRDLLRYLQGGDGLAKMPKALQQSLSAFLAQRDFPEVRAGIQRFDPRKFVELTQLLAKHPDLAPPNGFLPKHEALRAALAEWFDEPPRGPQPSASRGEGQPAPWRDLAKRLKGAVSRQEQNRILSEFLGTRLRHFRRVAILDQIWKFDRIAGDIVANRADGPDTGRAAAAALRRALELLAGKSGPEPDWDLWRRRPERADTGRAGGRALDPNPPLQRRLLDEPNGPARYQALDKLLPDRDQRLEQRLTELGWARRLERLARRIEVELGRNHVKLLDVVRRAREAAAELGQSIMRGGAEAWSRTADSPLTKRKLQQFQGFREALLRGEPLDVDALFEGPFLRAELGGRAEARQRLEMKRLEPLFRQMLADDAESDLVGRLVRALHGPVEGGQRDAATKVQNLVETIREFNQHQNLNQQPLYLSLPLRLDGKDCAFELAYFRMPGADKRKKRFLAVIHLDFEGWGHLRVDALKDYDSLTATFWAETARMHHRILQDLHLLEDRLEASGLGETGLTVKIEPSRARQSVAQLCAPGRDGRFDFWI